MTPLAWVISLPVRAYRVVLSPYIGHSCRFQPTCSAYAMEALEKRLKYEVEQAELARLRAEAEERAKIKAENDKLRKEAQEAKAKVDAMLEAIKSCFINFFSYKTLNYIFRLTTTA